MVVTGAVIYIVLMGFFVPAVRLHGGLIGAWNSPLSGIGIRAVIGAALLLLGVHTMPAAGPQALVAFALFVTAVVFAVATIANNNPQDPRPVSSSMRRRKQQVALVIACSPAPRSFPPILDVANHAFRRCTRPPREHALAAPGRRLISALAQGVIQHNIEWPLIYIGGIGGQ